MDLDQALREVAAKVNNRRPFATINHKDACVDTPYFKITIVMVGEKVSNCSLLVEFYRGLISLPELAEWVIAMKTFATSVGVPVEFKEAKYEL